MPNWKKLIVSGSDASLNSLNVTNNVTAQSFTGSFSGSFTAPGATTQVVYNSGGVLAANSGFVYSGSNVGIGTTSPQGKLEVFSSSDNQLRLDASGTYSAMYLTQNQTPKAAVWMNHGSLGMFVGTTVSNGYLALGTDNSSEKMRITSAGNVGIGTTSPSSKLHVTDTSNPTINIGTLNGNTGNASIQFYSGTGGSNNGFLLQYIKNGSTDRFGFIDGGSVERLTVLNGGNVGIGTTSPGAKLHVASGEIRVDAGQAVTLDTGNVMYLVGASSQLRLYNGGNPIVNITTGGNVGINTTSPSQVLEVQGQAQIGNDSVTSAGLFIARKNSNQAKSHYFLSAQESPTYQWIEGGYFTSELAGVSVANNSGKPYYEAYSPAGQYKTFGFINQQTSGSSFTSTAATASMVLYQGGNIALAPTQGNVGIGTYSPSARLHISGSTDATQRIIVDGSGNNSSLHLNYNGSNVGFINSYQNSELNIGTSVSAFVNFYTNNTERMRIAAGGNVGIGTTSPGVALDVNGSGIRIVDATNPNIYLNNGTVQWKTYLVSGGSHNFAINDAVRDVLTLGYNGAASYFQGCNVGIGTSSPSQKLDVAGAISVSGSVVDYEVAPALIGGITTTNIISFTPGTHYAAFVDYVIKDASTGANQRVGTIQVSISLAGAAAVMNEVTTIDIGNTSAITFAVSYGAPTWLTATNSGITPYDINYMVRYF